MTKLIKGQAVKFKLRGMNPPNHRILAGQVTAVRRHDARIKVHGPTRFAGIWTVSRSEVLP